MKIQPVRGQVYSLRQVENDLELRDSAFLCFTLLRSQRGGREVIQTSHVTQEQLLSVPGLAETKWRYMYETSEWIPIFNFVGDRTELWRCVDVENSNDYRGGLWVTPKGFPREQV